MSRIYYDEENNCWRIDGYYETFRTREEAEEFLIEEEKRKNPPPRPRF